MTQSPRKPWQEVAKEAQEYRDSTIRAVKPTVPDVPANLPLNVTYVINDLLTSGERAVTERPPERLLAQIADGTLSAETVTEAYLRRAGLAQKLANCVTELLPAKAIERARYLDEYYVKHGKTVGPLHGLPISVKEHIGMKDLGLNAGFISWWDRKGGVDAYILQLLWKAGCVFYVRTTQPQTLMHLETSSNLYGETVCPFNRSLTSGGSSGGEGALLGLRGSCLGIGTDIGGSIRSPAANNGVYGFRPSSYRLPVDGWAATMIGSEHIVPVIGPLSTSLDGIKIFMKTIIDSKPWLTETSLLPFPWRDGVDQLQPGAGRRLKVAVLWDDGIVKPHPPVQRALKEVVQKLKGKQDVEIVEWKPYKHDVAWEIIASLYFCDGAQEESEAIDASGEPWRPLSEFIIKDNPCVKSHSIRDMWGWTAKREEYRRAYAQVWNETATGIGPDGEQEGAVDVILCPVGPGAAPPLNHAKYWGYTAQWNLLDYPALVFPVTKVDQELDVVDGDYKPRNEKDEWNHKLYKPENYVDAPVSLQLVGRRYEDEKVIQALELIKHVTGLHFAPII